jgi:DNA-binding NarL/FixJ family response regulator
MINVIIADHLPIFRAGIAKLLAVEDDIHIIAQPSSPKHLLNAIERLRPSVVILSSGFLPVATEIRKIIKVTNERQVALLVLFGKTESASTFTSLGVRGVLCRSASGDILIEGVRRLARDGFDMPAQVFEEKRPGQESAALVGQRVTSELSCRELRIIAAVVRGYKYREIAAKLGTSEQMIKNAMAVIYDKMGVSDRLEMTLFVIHHHMLAPAPAPVDHVPPGSGIQFAA